MRYYRVYTVASNGGFFGKPNILTANEDREAMRQAVETADAKTWGVEVWNEDRLVALLPLKLDELDPARAPMPALPTQLPAVGRVERERRTEGLRAAE